LDKKDFLTSGFNNGGDDKSVFGSSCGSPFKRLRRTRDERKKINNIGKKENNVD